MSEIRCGSAWGIIHGSESCDPVIRGISVECQTVLGNDDPPIKLKATLDIS